MKNLLYKELKLAINPVAFIMPLLCALLLIRDYLYLIAFMYTFITIPIIFTVCKEQKDIYFTALLPVRKKDAVKARFISVIAIELLQIIVAVPFAIINNKLYPEGNMFLMDANTALFGLVFIMYAIFNTIFLTGFYKTAYKIAFPLTLSIAVTLVYSVIIEFLIQSLPSLKSSLDTLDKGMFLRQTSVLFVGIIIYILSAIISYKKSADNFEKIDV